MHKDGKLRSVSSQNSIAGISRVLSRKYDKQSLSVELYTLCTLRVTKSKTKMEATGGIAALNFYDRRETGLLIVNDDLIIDTGHCF